MSEDIRKMINKVRNFKHLVNENVAYHGTYADIAKFSIEGSKNHGAFDSELGIHFGSKEAAIDRLKQNAGDEDYENGDVSVNAKIIKVNTMLENPLKLDNDIGDWSNADNLKKAIKINSSNIKTIKDIKQYLISNGFDGIEYPNNYEGIKGETSYIVFNPNKIKILDVEIIK